MWNSTAYGLTVIYSILQPLSSFNFSGSTANLNCKSIDGGDRISPKWRIVLISNTFLKLLLAHETILIVLLRLTSESTLHKLFYISGAKSLSHILSLKLFIQGCGSFRIFITVLFLMWEVVSSTPNPLAGGPPFVCCLRLLIQCICRYPP
jgi:hypothetical protein